MTLSASRGAESGLANALNVMINEEDIKLALARI